jgi:hypothetical protein
MKEEIICPECNKIVTTCIAIDYLEKIYVMKCSHCDCQFNLYKGYGE